MAAAPTPSSMRRADRISPGQVRAARGLLGWSQETLAERSGLSRRTITHLENDQLKAQDDSHYLLRRAFENAGVIFVREGKLSGVVFNEDALGGSPGPLDGAET